MAERKLQSMDLKVKLSFRMYNGELWATDSNILTLEKFCTWAQYKLAQGDLLTFWCGSTRYNHIWWSWVVSGWAAMLWMCSDVAVSAAVGWQHTFSCSHILKPWDCRLLCFDSKSRELAQMQTAVLQTSQVRWYKLQCWRCKDGRQMLSDQCSAGIFVAIL